MSNAESAPALSFPPDKKRKELLTELLALAAKEDDKTVHLLLGMLAEVKKWAEND